MMGFSFACKDDARPNAAYRFAKPAPIRCDVGEREALIGWLRDEVPAERRVGLVQEAAEAMWLLANRTTSIALRDELSTRSPRIASLAGHPMILLEDEARSFATGSPLAMWLRLRL